MFDTNPLRQHELNITRRQLFGRSALGLGTAAMAHLLGPDLDARQELYRKVAERIWDPENLLREVDA